MDNILSMNLIVACDVFGGIGVHGGIPWNIPEDLKRFKELTMGSIVIMGRLTWNSIPACRKPLIGRVNIVLSRYVNEEDIPGVHVVKTLQEAINLTQDLYQGFPIFIIGGSTVYLETLSRRLIDKIYITLVRSHGIQCDTFFPLHDVKNSDKFGKYTIIEYIDNPHYSFITMERNIDNQHEGQVSDKNVFGI